MDGSDLRQLTIGGGNFSPHTTPDANWVVYSETRDNRTRVCRIPIAGGEPLYVTVNESSYPRVSSDGTLIACRYQRDRGSPAQLALLNSRNGTPDKLFNLPKSSALGYGMRWTPDGKAVCYRDRVNGIWRQEISGGPPNRLPDLREEQSFPFGWSRDGKQFAFTRGRAISDAVLISYFR